MIIFQRMQIWGATLLLTMSLMLAACGDTAQTIRTDENIVVVYGRLDGSSRQRVSGADRDSGAACQRQFGAAHGTCPHGAGAPAW